MLAALRLLRLARPMIAALKTGKDFKNLLPILQILLPEVIKFLDKNKKVAKQKIDRPDTTPKQDLEDVWRDGDFNWDKHD